MIPRALLLLFCLSLSAPAIIDTNGNGVSDLWEKQFNSGNLFTTFDLLADPDGDGWTNAHEATAGSDHLDANSTVGFLRPEIDYFSAVYGDPEEEGGPPVLVSPETVSIRWPTLPGKKYTVLFSPDLATANWLPVGEPRVGSGSIITAYIPLTQPDGGIPERLFWRVAVEDTDTDGDSLNNYEEYLAGTDPVISDSDGDTLSDHAEIIAGTNPNNADEDGDGFTDPLEIAAGTASNNQDSDGDAIPDSIDGQPLLSAQAFADTDLDGIPDGVDANPNHPRGPAPSIAPENASGNPFSNLIKDETIKFVLAVSNPSGPAPTASNLTFFLNGDDELAEITALTDPPSAVGTQRFLLSWNTKLTTGYPARTLQNISLRFKDAQNATAWLNLARIDVAEWEGMIAGMSRNGQNSGDFPAINVTSHHRGVRQAPQRLIDIAGKSVWYRGPKAIPLLDASGSHTGTTAQIGAERYPLFLISKSGAAHAVEQTLDISDPTAYPHHGYLYVNRTSAAITMSPATVGSIIIPGAANGFQPFPPAPETGSPNIGVLGTSVINGAEHTIYSGVWELLNASGYARYFNSLEFTSITLGNGTSEVASDGTGGLRAGIGATITPHSAGTPEHPGLPISPPNFPPAPYANYAGPAALLPIQPEQWHKLVLKAGPDAAALSNGIQLKLGTGEDGDGAPQTGFTLQIPTASGFTPLTLTAGRIDMAPDSEQYQRLTSPTGLTLFLKRDDTVNEVHRLGLDLIAKNSSYTVQHIAALDLLPVELRGYTTGERNSSSSEANEKYRHLIPDPADYTGFKTESKTELKIVQWGDNDVFDANNNGAFDHAKFKLDVDIFRIRLPDIDPPAGTAEHRIKIWTVDAAGTTLDQGAEVDLNVFDNFHETAALGLVADDETDDTFAVEGKADGALGDRTYRAKLGGKLKFQWLTCPGTGEKPVFEIPIRVKKIVTAKGFLLKGTTDAATATYWFERAKKIYSAIGVDLQYSLHTIDPLPTGVDLAGEGFDIPEEITGYLHKMRTETKALMDDPGCQVTPGTIPVFFVNKLNPPAQGVTNTPSYMAPGDEKYGGAIFIDSTHRQESVLAHELAHALLDAQHDPSSNALWNDYFLSFDRGRTNIWFGNQSELQRWSEAGISAHRRLADTMRSRIWKSPYAKNL